MIGQDKNRTEGMVHSNKWSSSEKYSCDKVESACGTDNTFLHSLYQHNTYVELFIFNFDSIILALSFYTIRFISTSISN